MHHLFIRLPAALLLCVAIGTGLTAQTRRSADGIYSESQAHRGDALFAEHCAPCHGTALAGTDFGPGLTDTEFRARWNSRSVADLFTLMQTTMPQNSPGGLSPAQTTDILAFILQRAK